MHQSTSEHEIMIRRAQSSDVPVILALIKELAEYERLSHEVTATEMQLNEHLFGDSPKAEVLIAERSSRPIGFALFFQNFSTFLAKPGIYLEDLYVKPEQRGKGVGKALLKYLARIAVERGCGRLEWAVLNWNEPAIKFYKLLHAQPMNDWTIHRVTGSALENLAADA
jgi:GNAT superfamily N-acetyltransferase